MYVTLRRVRVTIVAVEKQQILHICAWACACICVRVALLIQHATRVRCTVT